MTKRSKGRKEFLVRFDRAVPPVLVKPIEYRYVPGKDPTILSDGPAEIDKGHSEAQLIARLAALGEVLGLGSDAWKEPYKLTFHLAAKVFPGFRSEFTFSYQSGAGSTEAPFNPTLIRWYQRSIELRRAGTKKEAALAQAGVEILGKSHKPTVLSMWKRVKGQGLIGWFESQVMQEGLDAVAERILQFPAHRFEPPAVSSSVVAIPSRGRRSQR